MKDTQQPYFSDDKAHSEIPRHPGPINPQPGNNIQGLQDMHERHANVARTINPDKKDFMKKTGKKAAKLAVVVGLTAGALHATGSAMDNDPNLGGEPATEQQREHMEGNVSTDEMGKVETPGIDQLNKDANLGAENSTGENGGVPPQDPNTNS
ncbi:MAG: hypothetical protein M3P98_03775 [bacterium]|nr:hypothetical protein [bacterium]